MRAWVRSGWHDVYGQSPHLREELQARGVGYVLAVASSHRVAFGPTSWRADQVAANSPKVPGSSLSAGAGAKGQRWYDWAFAEIDAREARPPGFAGPPEPSHR